MKSIVTLAAVLTMTTSAFAAGSKVEDIAKKLKNEDTRTVIKVVESNGYPCLPEGKSYIVDLQVKQAAYDRLNNVMIYNWVTVKTIGVSLDGSVMEVCGE
ncbi:hypothetical protein ACLVWU_10815 [Bdellovibrio sp. HCB290]|uniref:hypothetical protein n=1 Tax=Bdellovibrio sp. HCB290 TaxID=3394356 RepID=UPI0039B3F329